MEEEVATKELKKADCPRETPEGARPRAPLDFGDPGQTQVARAAGRHVGGAEVAEFGVICEGSRGSLACVFLTASLPTAPWWLCPSSCPGLSARARPTCLHCSEKVGGMGAPEAVSPGAETWTQTCRNPSLMLQLREERCIRVLDPTDPTQGRGA